MGLTYADIVLESTFRQRSLPARALVDSGAVFMIIPSHFALQLRFDVEAVSTREVSTTLPGTFRTVRLK
jgi:hypothetical protein